MAGPVDDHGKPSRIQEVRRAGYTVHAAVGVILAPTSPVAIAALFRGGTLGPSGAIDLGEIFVLTLPLALGTAVIAGMLSLGIRAHPMVYIGIGAIVLAICSLGAESIGAGAGVDVLPPAEGDQRVWLARMLGDYFTVYGEATFVCSLIVGSYAGWAVAHLSADE